MSDVTVKTDWSVSLSRGDRRLVARHSLALEGVERVELDMATKNSVFPPFMMDTEDLRQWCKSVLALTGGA